jgi:sialate O-acetylesterase
VVWFRKRITIPDDCVGKYGELRFGTLEDADDFYIDGKLVGHTDYQYPPRNYPIGPLPKSFVLAIRLVSYYGTGCFSAGKTHCVVVGENGETCKVLDIDAMGSFAMRRACLLPPKYPPLFFSQMAIGDFNAMIYPLRKLAVAGALWYQGESNTGAPEGYARKFARVITSWRELFEQGDFPFIFVQLPNIGLRAEDADGWSRIRDEQRKTLAVANTAMAVTVDVGEDADLHPLDKLSVGERLAICAEGVYYGSSAEFMGPLPERAWVEGTTLYVQFSHVGDGLASLGPIVLEIGRGEGGCDTKVTAEIANDDTISAPLPGEWHDEKWQDEKKGSVVDTVVRYAWSSSPRVLLANSAGLLASPFEMAVSN